MAKQHEFSQRSLEQLRGCDPRLQAICKEVLKLFTHDITIIEGWRSDERQMELYNQGKSKLKAGESKHNNTYTGQPWSEAVDMAPLVDGKIDWNDREL